MVSGSMKFTVRYHINKGCLQIATNWVIYIETELKFQWVVGKVVTAVFFSVMDHGDRHDSALHP